MDNKRDGAVYRSTALDIPGQSSGPRYGSIVGWPLRLGHSHLLANQHHGEKQALGTARRRHRLPVLVQLLTFPVVSPR